MGVISVPFDSTLKDMYPGEGKVIKQWVVDMWREAEWERETCPKVNVHPHEDNCGCSCRNVGSTQWSYLDHDSCYECNDLQDARAGDLDIAAWQMERANRPPVCTDRDRLSDQVQPSIQVSYLRDNPFCKMAKKP